MQLILLTPEYDVANETEIVNRLFDNGLQRLHVRKPSYTTAGYRRYIAAINNEFHNRIVIHGSFNLFEELGLGGIHLNSMARENKSVWEEIAHIASSNISTSFHSWQEICDNEFEYNYVFISPVFDSISKKEYVASIELAGCRSTKLLLEQSHRYCPQIIGLGGVGQEQAGILHEYGFDGAAMLGAVWMAEKIVDKSIEIKMQLN